MSKNVLHPPPDEPTSNQGSSSDEATYYARPGNKPPTEPAAEPMERTPTDGDATMAVRPVGPRVVTERGAEILQRVAGYEILDELGRGGMGVVYKAWQHSLQRTVALKMILAGSFASPLDLERFRAEAMAIARLHHPNLLNIYEIGESTDLPFYAMEYMEGGSLAHRLNGMPIAPRVAAGLIRSLAQAMDYAHKNGIVHRDLKPANILLGGKNDTPLDECAAKITDFGIAKHLHRDSSSTRTGDILGTPHYMAPEQAAGRSAEVGPSADVYSLGAMLYELLTGRTPFHGHDGAAVLILATREEPERPSRWVSNLPRDLQTICMKCLEKDPAKRYASASALAEDLARFLANEPIEARPASLVDRTLKWTRRRPAVAAASVMAVAASLLAFGLITLMWRQAVAHSVRQDELLTESKMLLADAFLDRGIHLAEKGDVRRGMHWMMRSLEMTDEVERKTGASSALASIIRMNLASWGQCVGAREMLLPHGDWVWDVAFTPDRRFAITGSRDTKVQVWDARTAQPVGGPLVHPYAVWGIAMHPDGKTLFTICGEDKEDKAGSVTVWSADPQKPGHFTPRGAPMRFPYGLFRMQMNASGDRIWVSSTRAGTATLLAFDPAGQGNGLQVVGDAMPGHHPLAVFSENGVRLATIVGILTEDGKPLDRPRATGHVQLWDGRTGDALGPALEHVGPVRAVHFSKDGRYLITASATPRPIEQGETSVLEVWDVEKRARVAVSPPLPGRVKAMAGAPNGQMFAVSVFDFIRAKDSGSRIEITGGHVQLWQLHGDGQIESYGTPLRTDHVVWHMAFSPDNRMLLAGCENFGAFLWSVANCQRLTTPIWHEGNSVKVAFSPDGRQALTASAGGTKYAAARLWEVPSFAYIGPPLPQATTIRGAVWEKDGQHVWIGCDRQLYRCNPLSAAKLDELALPARCHHLHRRGDAKRLLVEFVDRDFQDYRFDTKQFEKLRPPADARHSQFSYFAGPDRFVQFNAKPCWFQLLDADCKVISRRVVEPEYELSAVELSPRGDCVAVAQTILKRSNRLILYDPTNDLSKLRTIPLQHPILALAFSSDGKTLALGGGDRQIQRLDVQSGEFIGSPFLHEGVVNWVSFLDGDRLLATSSDKGLILLWDAKTGKRIGPAFEHRADLQSIAVHPQGKSLLIATRGKMAMCWQITEPVEGSLDHTRLWVQTMTGMEMKEHDTIVPIEMERVMQKRAELSRMGGAPLAQ